MDETIIQVPEEREEPLAGQISLDELLAELRL